MSKCFTFSMMVFLSIHVISQSITISGKVVDVNNKHIPYAHITALSTKNTIVSNSSGIFSIHINQSDSLLISAVGFTVGFVGSNLTMESLA